MPFRLHEVTRFISLFAISLFALFSSVGDAAALSHNTSNDPSDVVTIGNLSPQTVRILAYGAKHQGVEASTPAPTASSTSANRISTKPRPAASQELEPQEIAWIFLAIVVGIVIMTVSLLLIAWRVLAPAPMADQRHWPTTIDIQNKELGSKEDINFALTMPSPPPLEMLRSANDTPPQINIDTPPPFPVDQPPRLILPSQPLHIQADVPTPRWQKELFRFAWIGLVIIGFLCSVILFIFAMDDLELRSTAKDQPQTMSLERLLQRGPQNNHHVTVTDFRWSGDYVAEKATPSRWNWVVAALSVEEDPVPNTIPLIARFDDLHSLKDLQKACTQTSITGVLRQAKDALNSRAQAELIDAGYNLANAWLLDVGLDIPSKTGMLLKFLGSIVACGIGLLPILSLLRIRWLRHRASMFDLDLGSLGLPIRVHPTAIKTKLQLLFGTLGLFTLSGLAFYFVYNPHAIQNSMPRGFLLGAAIFLLLLGCVGMLVTWSLHNVTYVIYSHGVLQQIGSKHHFIRWDEIKDIWQLGLPPHPPRYRLALITNEIVDLRNTIRDLSELGEYITEKVNERYLPAAIITLEKGGVVSFGPIDVSRSGLSYKDKFMPWRNIKKVVAGFNQKANAHILEIRSVGKSQQWVILLSTVPNIRVFYQLVQHFCSGTIKKSVDNLPPA